MKFTYTGIRVTDLDRSTKFYTEVMGMEIVHKGRMRAGGTYVLLKGTGSPQRLELNFYPKDNIHYEPYREGSELDHLAFWVGDVDATYANLLKKGAKKAIKPFTEGRYRLAFAKDPDSIWIELIGLLKKPAKKKQR